MIKFNKQIGKFEGFVNGKCVSRAATEERVAAFMERKYGVKASKNENQLVKEKSEFSVKERFEFIETFTKLVARGVVPSMIITGSGGLGKSHTVLETLQSLGLQEDTIGTLDGDFVFFKGYSTARNVYTTLYRNNGKIIVFDDCDSSFRDPIGAGLFKAALDSSERRIINWGAESKEDEVPSRFEFTGKVIFISNLEMGKFPQALLSRSMLVDLTLNKDEKIERIEQVFGFDKRYDDDDKSEVLAFIRKYADKAKDLNIRTALSVLKLKVALGENWERAALYNFSTNG